MKPLTDEEIDELCERHTPAISRFEKADLCTQAREANRLREQHQIVAKDNIRLLDKNCRLRADNSKLRELVQQVLHARGCSPKNLAIMLPDSFYSEAEAALEEGK